MDDEQSIQQRRTALARVLRESREARGLSKAELARRAGMKPDTITAYEAGRSAPGFERLIRLCRALGLTMTEFVTCMERG